MFQENFTPYVVLIFPIIALIAFFWKPKIAPKGTFFEDFLSLENTTSLRGITALGIIFAHTGVPIFYQHGYLCVALFFFLSGYGLMQGLLKKENYLKNFISHRLTKLFLPYWTSLTLFIIWLAILGCIFDVKTILLSYFFPYINAYRILTVAWYVCTISIFYVFFYTCFKFLKKLPAIVVMFFLILIYIILCKYFFHKPAPWYTSCIPFWIGIVFAYKSSWLKAIMLKAPLLLFTLSIVILFISTIFEKIAFTSLHLIGSCAITFSTILVLSKIRGRGRFFYFLGKNSYEFYLCHYMFMLFLDNSHSYVSPSWKDSIFSLQIQNQSLVIIGTTFCTLCLAYFLHIFNKKLLGSIFK